MQQAQAVPVDIGGSEFTKIVLPLQRSCQFYITVQCSCSTKLKAFARTTKRFSIRDVQALRRNSLNVDQALHIPYTKGSCAHCSMPSTIQYLLVPDTTWFLYFDFDVPDKLGFDITELPLELKIHELTRTGQLAIFKLSIVSLLSS